MDQQCSRKVRFSGRKSIRIIEKREKRSSLKTDPRKAAREQAYRLIQKGYGELLKGSFECPTENCQENINAFVAGVPDSDNVRGLERYLSHQHKDERDMAREDVLDAVLRIQDHLEKQGLDQDECAERIRAASCLQSQEARMFARRLGIADQLAVREDPDGPSEITIPSCHPLHPQIRHSFPSACNAKKALRQPSLRELDTGIRSMAACMNAKKASRQASIRNLNSSIRNLAATMQDNSCRRHSENCSSHSVIHPSFVRACSRQQDQALTPPGRSHKPSDCSGIIDSALNLVDEGEAEDRKTIVARSQVAQSA